VIRLQRTREGPDCSRRSSGKRSTVSGGAGRACPSPLEQCPAPGSPARHDKRVIGQDRWLGEVGTQGRLNDGCQVLTDHHNPPGCLPGQCRLRAQRTARKHFQILREPDLELEAPGQVLETGTHVIPVGGRLGNQDPMGAGAEECRINPSRLVGPERVDADVLFVVLLLRGVDLSPSRLGFGHGLDPGPAFFRESDSEMERSSRRLAKS
jgi:hypothetical protein